MQYKRGTKNKRKKSVKAPAKAAIASGKASRRNPLHQLMAALFSSLLKARERNSPSLSSAKTENGKTSAKGDENMALSAKI
jgi:hypothetical protein